MSERLNYSSSSLFSPLCWTEITRSSLAQCSQVLLILFSMISFELPVDEKNVSLPSYVSSLHKEPAVWRWNMNRYIYLPKEVELHKDVLCVSDCHDCHWIWKGLRPQIIHPLTFYNYIVDRRGLHIFIWLTTMWEFLVIKAADSSNMVQQDWKTAYLIETHSNVASPFVVTVFVSQKSELCWSRWQESNEGVWGSYWLSGVLHPRSHSWLQDRWQGEMKMISIPEKMVIFIVRLAKQTAQRFDL